VTRFTGTPPLGVSTPLSGDTVEQIVFKKSLHIAVLTLLQAIAPAVVATGCLYALAAFLDVPIGEPLHLLSTAVAVLAIAIMHAPRSIATQFSPRRLPMPLSVLVRWTILLAALLAIGYITKISAVYSRRVILSWAVITPVFIILANLGLRELIRKALRSPTNARSVVFAGCNEASLALATGLTSSPELCMSVAGFFDDRSMQRLSLRSDMRLLGRLSEVAEYVRRRSIEVIFIALPVRHLQRVRHLIEELGDTTASIYYVPDICAFDLIQSHTSEILGLPVVALRETPFYGYRGVIKRVTDIVVSLGTCLALAPLMVLIAIGVKLSSPGPVIFRQRRYGLDGREILIAKFRTMTVTEDGQNVVQAVRGDARVTHIGRVLRRYSLDELPQLFNVLEGSMSLVGPRPHAVAHNEQYRALIKGYMLRHKVLPGITGLAQVNGYRGETSRLEEMQARVHYDLEYLRHWSPMLDLQILLQTLPCVLRNQRAY